jgi:hypothetical protein
MVDGDRRTGSTRRSTPRSTPSVRWRTCLPFFRATTRYLKRLSHEMNRYFLTVFALEDMLALLQRDDEVLKGTVSRDK